MGSADPKPLKTSQNKANDSFADILKGIMQGGDAPGGTDFGTWVQDTFKMPAYAGPLSAGPNASQNNAVRDTRAVSDKYYAAGGGADQVTSTLKAIMGDEGPSTDINTIREGMEPARQVSLKRDLGQMEEEFGLGGLSNSTSLAESGARAVSDSQSNLTAQLAQILPQLANARVAQGQNRINAAGLAQQGTGGVAQGEFNMGEGMRGIEDQGIQRQLQEFLRQSGLFPQILAYLNGTPPQQYAPSTLDNVLKIGTTGAAAVASI